MQAAGDRANVKLFTHAQYYDSEVLDLSTSATELESLM